LLSSPSPRHALVLAVLATAGCSPREWVEVQLRDPSAATVEIETPEGPKVVLPPGRDPVEVTLPRTAPPYGKDVLFEASALRDANGGITMRCDACLQAPLVRVVPAEGDTISTASVPNAGPVTLAYAGDALRMRLAYPYWVALGRNTTRGPFAAFRYDVVIPKDAVAEAREKREDLHGPGWVTLLVGAVVTAGSIVLIDVGARGFHDQTAPGESIAAVTTGLVLLTPGVLLDIFGLSMVLAPAGYDRRVTPP
jgi:hypothetical protein